MSGTARTFKLGWDYRTDLAGATQEVLVPAPLRGTQICIEMIWMYVEGGGSDILLEVLFSGGQAIPVLFTTTTSNVTDYEFRGPLVLETSRTEDSDLVFSNINGAASLIHVTAEWVKR